MSTKTPKIAQNDSEIFRDMAEGVELVSGMVTRYAIIESLYLLEASAVRAQLTEAIVNLYIAILQYLLVAKSYYKKRTIRKLFPPMPLARRPMC